MSKSKNMELCTKHKLEKKAWGSEWDRGLCINCIHDKVDIMWELLYNKEDK